MARPLRLQVAGGVYHVVARGNGGQTIFRDDHDRHVFLSLVKAACRDHEWTCWAYCLMGTHYHLLIHTARANLSTGMRGLNGRFVRKSHDRHGTDGHLFKGRFFSSLIEQDAHVLAVARYIAMNPVEAGLCESPDEWPWSSYRETCAGRATAVSDPRPLLEQFDPDPAAAGHAYRAFVLGVPSAYAAQDVGRYGGDGFAHEHLPSADERPTAIPQRYLKEPRRPLPVILGPDPSGHDLAKAYTVDGYSMNELARHIGRHRTTVARYIRLATDQRLDATALDLTPRS
jgi:REP element-mobilizing transposase RayT